ncbi:MAG TPA: hypothetical protein DCO75_05995, partial [Fibrobacteres bacterium]|nr:hypothetical protein [Fibrobacterota bacterium]
MHPRKWVIALACIALVLGGLLYGGVVFFEKSRDVKRLIVQAISASTGSGFSVERIRLGFLSVYLENVTIGFSTPFYHLAIHDIKVGFSLKNLISYKGDVGKSINRLILINPELSIFVNNAGTPSRDSVKAVPADVDIFSAMRSFPVDHFLVRKGTVRLYGIGSDGFTIGENLTGGISSGSGGVELDLHGSLASHKKNFELSGLLSKETRRSRISISINKARIDKPIRWNNSVLHSGVIDGVCEYSVPDSMTQGNIESRGWVTLGGATVKVDKIDKPITGLAFSLTFLDSRIRLDSAVCKWNGIAVKGSGVWNLFSATDSSSAIDIHCQGIKVESLFPENSKSIGKIIRGTGWGIVRLSKGGLFGRQLFSVTGGGISVWNSPVFLSAKGSFERGRVLIESCVLRSPAVTAGISGIVNYAPAPVSYSLEYTLKADSLPQIPDLKGSGHYSGRGRLNGIGAEPKFNITVNGSRIRYFDAPAGDPEVTLTGKNINHISFDCNSPSFFHASGMIDSLAGGKPVIRADLSAGSKLMLAILERKNPALARIVDSASINSAFNGNTEEFDVIGKAELYSHIMHGGFQFRFNKYKKNKAVSWRITQQNMYAGDSLIPFSANGSIDKNSLRIDSFNVAGAIHGAGRCGIDAVGNMDLYFNYKDLSVCALNTWFMHRSLPAKKGVVSGNTRISGIHGRISTESEIHVQDCSINDFNDIETDVSIKSKDTVFTILPGVIKKEGVPLVFFDTVSNSKGIFFSGHFDNIPVKSLLSGNIHEEYASGDSAIKGYLSGVFYSVKSGDAARITVNCPFVEMGCWKLDSISADLVIDRAVINVERFYVTDSNRTRLSCNGNIPWTFLNNAQNDSEAYDTMNLHLKAEGDLLATFEKNVSRPYHLPVAGKAMGTVDIEISGASGVIRICKVTGGIPHGILRVKPYVAKDINDFSLDFAVNRHNESGYGSSDTSAIPPVDLYMKGSIDKKPIRIYTSHAIPHGFESLKAGLADLGVIHVVTPQGGVNLHLPGLMAPGVTGEIELKPNKSYTAFMLSGPVDHLRITGTCILHNGEFTFPPLSNSETVVHFDPFPYITWDMDLKAANRKLKYFYDAGTKSHKLIRMVECYLDPVS